MSEYLVRGRLIEGPDGQLGLYRDGLHDPEDLWEWLPRGYLGKEVIISIKDDEARE